ncbi:DinB family protein [Priestia abyssalis]|uniref:DinB family protein n=1 Tax=Priestia abyssalis TaxID=1221450 RepID=UPI001474CD2E|nr:DinB family protein [Priestia abyssalis]
MELPPTDYQTEIQSVFPTIADTIQHIYDVDFLWLSRCMGGEALERLSIHTPEEAQKAFDTLHTAIDELINGSDVTQTISYQNSTGNVFTNTVEEVIRHLVNHGTYHRGNITAMLRQIGHRGVSTDYIYFMRQSWNEM